MERIQKKISEALLQCEMTQEELAKKIGVHRGEISKYLHMKRTPSHLTLAKLCAVLDLDANDILCVAEFKN